MSNDKKFHILNKRNKMSKSPVKKMSTDEVMKVYLNITRSYPLSCKTFEAYNPDNLPKVLKDQMKHHPSIRKFAKDVYNTLISKGFMNYSQFDNLIGSFNISTTPKRSPLKKLSYNDLFKIYISLTRTFPMTFGNIVAVYHPDNLPPVIQEQMKVFPNIDVFCKKVYNDLVSEGIIYNENQFESLLLKHVHRITPSSSHQDDKKKKKTPLRKMQYNNIMNIYTSMITVYPITYKKLLLLYHPDKVIQNVPVVLREQIISFPEIANLYTRWFNVLRGYKHDIANKKQLEKLLLTEKL